MHAKMKLIFSTRFNPYKGELSLVHRFVSECVSFVHAWMHCLYEQTQLVANAVLTFYCDPYFLFYFYFLVCFILYSNTSALHET